MQIIDALYVEFGLDPSKFTEGQKKVVDDLENLKNKSKKTGEEVSEGARAMEQGFAALQRRLLAVVGLFVGVTGIGRFTEQVTELTSAAGRLSQSLQLNVRDFGAWERLGQSIGASNLGQGIAALQERLNREQMMGGGGLYQFSQLSTVAGQGPPVPLFDKNGPRSMNDIMLDMSRWWKAQQDKGKATTLLKDLAGLDQGMINAIMLGPNELKKRLEEYRKYAPTNEQVEQFQKLQKAMADASVRAESLGRAVLALFSPKLIEILEKVGGALERTFRTIDLIMKGEYKKALENEAPGITNPSVEFSPKGVWGWGTERWNDFREWWKGKPKEGSAPAQPQEAPALTPGPATGSFRDRIGTAKRAMMDQLRKEGIPEANLEEAANLLAGQAIAESKLNPSTVHDQGTGYGIYGARLGRRAKMLAWMKAKGYPPSSLEGQSAYMAHEAMSGDYPRTRDALMGATSAGRAVNQRTLTAEFERPAYINNRLGPTNQAAGVAAAGGVWEREAKPFGAFDFGNIAGADLIPGTRAALARDAGQRVSNQNSTSIGDINVYSHATDGPGVARDLHADLARQHDVVIHADTGLE